MTSRAAIEAKVIADRQALNASVIELRTRLSPSALSHEVGETLTARAADVSHTLGDRASTPAGLIALCAMAFSTAFAASGALKRTALTHDVADKARPALPRVADFAPLSAHKGETARMLLQLSAAIAAGAVISRFLPQTEAERTILAGVGPELKRAVQTQIQDQANRLVAPKGSGFGVVNLLAMGAAVMLSGKTRSR